MIERVNFENFRGFEKLELSDFKPITLISGKNNAGKSSILEGIFLFFDHLAPDSFMKINRIRGLSNTTDPLNLWEPLFYNMDTEKKIKLSMQYSGKPMDLEYIRDDTFVPSFAAEDNIPLDVVNQFVSSAKHSYPIKFEFHKAGYKEKGHFIASPEGVLRKMNLIEKNKPIEPMPFTQFINSTIATTDGVIVDWFGKMELKGKKQQVIKILQIIEPSISDVTTLAMNGQIQLYIRINEKLFPLKVAGDGLNKLLFIILAILVNQNAIILIDEIETGFHYSTYVQLWETIAKAAQESRCQIIASTHSYECIVCAIDGMERAGTENDFCYFRVDKKGTKNFAYRYSSELLRTAIKTEMEVR